MADGSDSSATQALIQATIEIEKAHEKSSKCSGWQATVENMMVNPACHEQNNPASVKHVPDFPLRGKDRSKKG